MPRKYRIKKIKTINKPNHGSDSDSGYDSSYESDGGTEYAPKDELGEGRYARTRLFESKTNKNVAVLNPIEIPADLGEARIKHHFFETIYSDTDNQSAFFAVAKDDYRLIVPYIKGTPYEALSGELKLDSPEAQKQLFQSAIRALAKVHQRNMIIVDLKADNILYDKLTAESYFIDGGSSSQMGTAIDPQTYQLENQEAVAENQKKYNYIPPECWSVQPQPVLATKAMDIFCLGVLMLDSIESPAKEIQALIDRCLSRDPQKRPTLEQLSIALEPPIPTQQPKL